MQGTLDLSPVLDDGFVFVRTKQEFDTLMNALEQVGVMWPTGDRPTSYYCISAPVVIHIAKGTLTWCFGGTERLRGLGKAVYDFDDLMDYDVGELSDLMNLFTEGRSDCCG